MRAAFPPLNVIPLVADVCDELRVKAIFTSYRPHVVLHAAAHKHVPMMEINAGEAVKNNILATRLVGETAGKFGAEVFVLISTDKAVHPTSVMGASKRFAELVIQDLESLYDTRFVAVRFGNVIGSAGSVIPIFREQIFKGGPVTVTHPDMVRYFMTIRKPLNWCCRRALSARAEKFSSSTWANRSASSTSLKKRSDCPALSLTRTSTSYSRASGPARSYSRNYR
jgi:FlaA1/EpsC-like NDP-sugar epimerase